MNSKWDLCSVGSKGSKKHVVTREEAIAVIDDAYRFVRSSILYLGNCYVVFELCVILAVGRLLLVLVRAGDSRPLQFTKSYCV